MITTKAHAIAVQRRRAESGKRGISKAVRRFMKRTDAFALREHLPKHPAWN